MRFKQPSKFLMCTTTLYAQIFSEFVTICCRDITSAGKCGCQCFLSLCQSGDHFFVILAGPFGVFYHL